MMRLAVLLTTLAVALLFISACGGGSDHPTDASMNAVADGSRDGCVWDGPGVSPIADSNPLGGVPVGDWYYNVLPTPQPYGVRGFVSFTLAGLPPPPARVKTATLEIYQWGGTGNPYGAALGNVIIDHVDLTGGLQGASYGTATGGDALDPGFAVVSTNDATGWYTVDVTTQVGADQIAGRANSSFRLRFTTNTSVDLNDDQTYFNSQEDPAGNTFIPRLTIIYRP